jgi:hypothetical protein
MRQQTKNIHAYGVLHMSPPPPRDIKILFSIQNEIYFKQGFFSVSAKTICAAQDKK